MMIAHNYRIKYADDCHCIFLDEILLATINQGCENTWYVNINISGQHYLFAKSGKLNTSVSIHNIKAGEKSGEISVPFFPLFFRRSVFLRQHHPKISWCSKNFYSFHWVWKMDNEILLETVEDFVKGGSNGVINVSFCLDEPYLLIITGIFLSIRRKRRGLFGMLFNMKHKTTDDQPKQHYLPEAV